MYKAPFGFQSSLAAMLVDFVHEKRACGFKYNRAMDHLRRLDRLWFTPGSGTAALSREWFLEFIQGGPGTSRVGPADRVSTWRELVRHARRRGMEGYLPEPGVTFIQRQSCYLPFIFTRAQLGMLFAAADQMLSRPCSPRCPRTIGLMLRLLYGTGLRLGEALALTHGDYDPSEQVLLVRQGKNQNERFIPLAAALGERLREYCNQFPGSADAPIFLSPRHPRALRQKSIRWNFYRLLERTGLPTRTRHGGPRVHDLRHTFAVHRLENWYLSGEDVTSKLPILSVYLGHRGLQETYYYLRITASFFPEIARRLEAYAGDVIPREEARHETH